MVQMHDHMLLNALLHLPTCACLQSDARKAIVVDGSEKILLMALCIFVVRMWSLQLLRLFKANPAIHQTGSMAG